MKIPVTLNVNGERHEVVIAPYRTLLDVLREELRRLYRAARRKTGERLPRPSGDGPGFGDFDH
jgi:aerobic-type carbon monoxide dehydrogenase small subunit (CoxS/CutS family)